MTQNSSGSSLKKRNYISPQKTQTSIVAYTNQISQTAQKKVNSNITPPRSALQRSQEAILSLSSPPATTQDLVLSNNPYEALSQEDDEEDESISEVHLGRDIDSWSSPKRADQDSASISTPDRTDETASTSSTTISSQEKVLLSRKALQALRKLRLARKALIDSSIREELETIYGARNSDILANIMQELNYQPSKGTLPSNNKATNSEGQEPDNMLIDESEDDVIKDKELEEDSREGKDLSIIPQNTAPGNKDAIHKDLQGRSIEIGKKSVGTTETNQGTFHLRQLSSLQQIPILYAKATWRYLK